MAFDTWMALYKNDLCLVPTFSSPQNKNPYPLRSRSSFPLPAAPANTSLLCVLIDLPVVDISYKWNLCLVPFT
jgi:hypothetical protein